MKKYQSLPRRFFAVFLIILNVFCVASCNNKAEFPPAKQPFFDSTDLAKADFGDFSVSYPENWNIIIDESIDDVTEGEVFFEVTGSTIINNNVSRFQIIKEYPNANEGVEDFLTLEDAETIVSSLSQTYNQSVNLDECGIYNYNGVCGMNIKASLIYNETPYIIYQTYFLINGRIYIFSGCVANGADEKDVASIPYSVSFPLPKE